MVLKRSLVSGVGALTLLLATSAQAQDRGFALNRYEPAEPGSDWFVGESLDLRGDWRPAAGVVFDYASKPLGVYDAEGNEIASIVDSQFFAHLGGAVIAWDRIRFGLNVPLLLVGTGDRVVTPQGDFTVDEGFAFGDPRLGADALLLGAYGAPVSIAAGAQVFLPLGSRDAYTSDGAVRVRPRVMVAGDVSTFAYAAQVGLHLRPAGNDFAGTTIGNELTYALSAGVRLLDRTLLLGPELHGATTVADPFGEESTPIELLVGGKYTLLDDYRVGLEAGPGLTQGFGAPDVRALLSVEWFPAEKRERDRDRDGVADPDDRCPSRHAGSTPDPLRPGCPARDGDRDGIVDVQDACPTIAGEPNVDPKQHGCPLAPPPPPQPPPPDTDRDGIPDGEDACPQEPGVIQDDPTRNGCPRARLEQEAQQIRIIQRIEFDYDKATLTRASFAVLQDVQRILDEHPEITLVEIQGYTDNIGDDEYNQTLSEQRAATVRIWLISKGISPHRLVTVGFGKSRPLSNNDSEEGRQQNRRVEFHIREQRPVAPVPPESPGETPPRGEGGATPAPRTAPPPTDAPPADAAPTAPAPPPRNGASDVTGSP